MVISFRKYLSLYQAIKFVPTLDGGSNIILLLSIVYSVGFIELLFPPSKIYWISKISNSHFAYIVVSPILPVVISDISFIRSLSLYQATKFAPSLVGGSNIILLLSIVYFIGFVGLLFPPSNTYRISKPSKFHFAYIVVSPILPVGIPDITFKKSLSLYQATKVAPVLVGNSNTILLLSIVYFSGFASLLFPPSKIYWILKVSNSHFAYIVVSPILPVVISDISFIRSLSLYQAIKFAPSLVGDSNIILLLSIVYFTGFAGLLFPPSRV